MPENLFSSNELGFQFILPLFLFNKNFKVKHYKYREKKQITESVKKGFLFSHINKGCVVFVYLHFNFDVKKLLYLPTTLK